MCRRSMCRHGAGRQKERPTDEMDLDIVAMVDMIRRRDIARKQAQAAARKQKSGANDNADKASQPRKRPDVERSNEDLKLAK